MAAIKNQGVYEGFKLKLGIKTIDFRILIHECWSALENIKCVFALKIKNESTTWRWDYGYGAFPYWATCYLF